MFCSWCFFFLSAQCNVQHWTEYKFTLASIQYPSIRRLRQFSSAWCVFVHVTVVFVYRVRALSPAKLYNKQKNAECVRRFCTPVRSSSFVCWLFARVASQIWPFLKVFGLESFGLAFWHLFDLLCLALKTCLALMLFFGFFGLFYTTTTIEVTECAPTRIFRYHTLTVWRMVTYSNARSSAQWRNVTSLMSAVSVHCMWLCC